MKIKLFYFLFLGIMMLNVSCDPLQNGWRWSVKNTTEQTLKFKYPYYPTNSSDYWIATIAPGDSVTIFSGSHEVSRSLSFNYCFELIANKYGNDVSWQILSESDEVLKTWSYSDKGLPDQRFFEKSEWTFYEYPVNSGFVDMGYCWTFEILPEDVSED